jgi:hypothetical protein
MQCAFFINVFLVFHLKDAEKKFHAKAQKNLRRKSFFKEKIFPERPLSLSRRGEGEVERNNISGAPPSPLGEGPGERTHVSSRRGRVKLGEDPCHHPSVPEIAIEFVRGAGGEDSC